MSPRTIVCGLKSRGACSKKLSLYEKRQRVSSGYFGSDQSHPKNAARGRAAFDADELIQNWIVHHIQIIGEASGKIGDALRLRHAEVPWLAIEAMRNILVHFYFGINLDKVWQTVEQDIPVLKTQIEAILNELNAH